MTRASVHILDDDEEADVASFMLNACGLESHDFFFQERNLTRENFEKNYDTLVKMVHNRSFRRAPYFVIGYFALLTGAKILDKLQQEILEKASWKHEEGYWSDEGFALKRKIYLEDFREKIQIHKAGQRLHTAIFKYSKKDFFEGKVIVGINQFRDYCDYGKINSIKHINLDGWGLKSIPKEIFNLKHLKSLSLEFNELTEIPDEITKLKSLKSFYLDYNHLTKLPEGIGKLSSLQELSIIHNNISHLPKSIENLHNLKHLYVRGTKITQAPKFLKNAKYDGLSQTIYLSQKNKKKGYY